MKFVKKSTMTDILIQRDDTIWQKWLWFTFVVLIFIVSRFYEFYMSEIGRILYTGPKSIDI